MTWRGILLTIICFSMTLCRFVAACVSASPRLPPPSSSCMAIRWNAGRICRDLSASWSSCRAAAVSLAGRDGEVVADSRASICTVSLSTICNMRQHKKKGSHKNWSCSDITTFSFLLFNITKFLFDFCHRWGCERTGNTCISRVDSEQVQHYQNPGITCTNLFCKERRMYLPNTQFLPQDKTILLSLINYNTKMEKVKACWKGTRWT